jgi:AP-2 complex subunit alpha
MTEPVRAVFKQYESSLDAEIQQRAYEYLKLTLGSEDLLQTVWDVMPAFPERETNIIGQSSEKNSQDSPDINSERTKSKPKEASPAASPAPQPKQTYDPLKELEGIFGASPSVTSSSNVVAKPSSEIDDLLGGSNSTSFSSPVGPDLFALGGSSSAPTSANNGLSSLSGSSFGSSSVSSSGAIKLPKKITLANEGVLYQDGTIQIGFKSEYSQGVGRMMLYYGNVTSQPLQSFATSFSTQPSIILNAQPVGNVVEPRTQMQQMITMTCQSEFADSPHLEVRYNVGGNPVRLLLKLPIVVCKFMEPLKLNGPDFFNRWKQVEGPPLGEQLILKSPTGAIDIASTSKLLSDGFHFAVLQGVDPNANNIVAAANFRTSSAQVICLLRVETNPSHAMYRITLKTHNAQITTALKELLTEQLGEASGF